MVTTVDESVVRVVIQGKDESGNIRETIRETREEIRRTGAETKKYTNTVETLNGEVTKTTNSVKNMKEGVERFRFEFLGTMFLGMAVKRFFGQWVDGANSMLGATDLANQALSLFTLRALLPFKDQIFGVVKGLFGLDEESQRTVGSMILLGYGAGAVAESFSQLALGVASLKIVLGASLFASLATFASYFFLIAAAVTAAGVAIWGFEQIGKELKKGREKLGGTRATTSDIMDHLFGKDREGFNLNAALSDPLAFGNKLSIAAVSALINPNDPGGGLLWGEGTGGGGGAGGGTNIQNNNITLNMPQNADAQDYVKMSKLLNKEAEGWRTLEAQ